MADMGLLRLSHQSLVYHLRTQFSGSSWYPDSVDIIDSFPEDLRNLTVRDNYTTEKTQRKLPIIAVEFINFATSPLELGTTATKDKFEFAVHVFAQRDGERDDLISLCDSYLYLQTIPVLNYSVGFPPDITTQTGSNAMMVDSLRYINTSDKSSEFIAERHSGSLILTVEMLDEE